MFVPHTFGLALVMTVLSTICWGSFANTMKFTGTYRFELYYWDYAVGIVLISLVLAFTMGSVGGGETAFLANLRSAAPANLAWAAIAGFIFNVANFLLIAGIGLVGLAVAYPIAIGIALVEGVLLSYAIQPKGSAPLLGAGVAMAVLAVILIGKAYGQLQSPGRAAGRKGVVVCVVSGVLMGVWAPFVTRAMTAARPLTPYTVAVLFTLGALACCFVFNTALMRRPLAGTPVDFSGYRTAPATYHLLGLAGGIVWGVGTVFNLVAASLVGVAISYAIGQASPMVAALWGVFAWREFRGSSARAKVYLAGMFASYLLALLLIARAYRAG
ncbi:MAG: GRP family sugar transporter [Gemmatimonadales bacterium]|jgi:glucose uptake protein